MYRLKYANRLLEFLTHEINKNKETSLCIFAILFSIHFCGHQLREFGQRSGASLVLDHLLDFQDISVNSVGTVLGEIRYWSFLGRSKA